MIRLAVLVRGADAEAVLAELLELAPSGLEEREVEGGVEYVLYGAPGEVPDVGVVRAVAAVWSNLAETAAPWAPTVVANLPLELLLDVPVERPPERLFAAGFLVDRADEVAEAFGMAEVERRVLGEWAAVVLERP